MTGAVPLVVSARGEPGTAVKVIRAPGRGEVNGGRRRRAREKAAAALGVSALLAAVPLACFFFLLFLFGTAPDVERKGRKGATPLPPLLRSPLPPALRRRHARVPVPLPLAADARGPRVVSRRGVARDSSFSLFSSLCRSFSFFPRCSSRSLAPRSKDPRAAR